MSHEAAKQQPPSFISNTTYGPKTNVYVNSENPPPPPYTEEKQKRTTTIFGVRNDNVVVKTHPPQHPPQNYPQNQPSPPKPADTAPRRITLASRDSCSLPCSHYRPPANEIKTWWLFDGFREWCAYCNQLTKGENLVRTGDQLSGHLAHLKAAAAQSPWNNRMDYDESSTSDLEMEGFNDLPSSPNFHMNFPMVDVGKKEANKDLWVRSHQDDDHEEAYDEGLKPLRERQRQQQHHPRVHAGGVRLDKVPNHQSFQNHVKRTSDPNDPAFWAQDSNNKRTGNDFFIDDLADNRNPEKKHQFMW